MDGLRNRLGYVILAVEDVNKAVAFYEGAFGLMTDHVDEDGSYGEVVASDGVRIGFVADRQVAKATPELVYHPIRASDAAPGVLLHLITDDVKASFRRAVQAGAEALTEPKETPWGMHAAVRDCNGVAVEFSTAAPGWLD